MTARPFFLMLVATLALAFMSLTASAQTDRSATGGATTLQDIMERQKGLKVDESYRSDNLGDPAQGAPMTEQLGAQGGLSQAEDWRALRYGKADVTVQARGPAADVVIQDSGMTWLKFRRGPLATYGGWALIGMLVLLAVFYAIRGKIRIDGEMSGRKILRFASVERFAHWLLGGAFILLAITGLFQLFGRLFIIPLIRA